LNEPAALAIPEGDVASCGEGRSLAMAVCSVHELCHLREPSHQKPFWRLLGAALPGLQEQARWLREHGQELHEYVSAASLS
jgi:hypothetical protein